MDSGDFFLDTFGFPEDDYNSTQLELAQLVVGSISVASVPSGPITFTVGNRTIAAGTFSTPSVAELRESVLAEINRTVIDCLRGPVTVTTVFGNATGLHEDRNNDRAVIQAASQFNCLEFAQPSAVPEDGIRIYMFDHTQGPACAIACAAGTAVRNYLYRFPDGRVGQTKHNQINCLTDVENYLAQVAGDTDAIFWNVSNGYIESTDDQLAAVNKWLLDPSVREAAMSRLRLGVQTDTEVTLPAVRFNRVRQEVDGIKRWVSQPTTTGPMLVTQVYSSAISIGYSRLDPSVWAPTAQLVLDATYEATLLVGVLNNLRLGQSHPVFLTKVGGGVFRNDHAWIDKAIERAVSKVGQLGITLDVRIVQFSRKMK